jgi:hypothetical protein
VLVIAAGASLLRGGRYVYDEQATADDNTAVANTVRGNTVRGSAVPEDRVPEDSGPEGSGPEDPGPLADTALGTSPELAIEVTAEVADEAIRHRRR